MIDKLIKYHESVLCIIVAIAAAACSTTFYHDHIGKVMCCVASFLLGALAAISFVSVLMEDDDE